MNKMEKEEIKLAKEKMRAVKNNMKLAQLEIKLTNAETKKQKKEWKKNFVEFVNKYIMTPYRVSSVFPCMGEKVFIDKNNDGYNILGSVENKYFFTYLDGRETKLVVFEKHDDNGSESYKLKTLRFGIIGFPVTKSVDFQVVDSTILFSGHTIPNPQYKSLTKKINEIEAKKNKHISYLERK